MIAYKFRDGWAITIPKKITKGNRKIVCFKTEEEAKREAALLTKEAPLVDVGIPSILANDRVKLAEILDSVGGIDTLEKIAKQALLNNPSVKNRPVKQVFNEFMEEKEFEGVGLIQLKALRSRMARFIKSFKDRSISSFTPTELAEWLQGIAGVSNLTKRHIFQAVNQLLGFAERREYILRNAMKSVASPKAEEPAKEILTLEEFQKMLNVAEGEEKIFVALAGYAGLRTSEIMGNEDHDGLKWSEIDLERREIVLDKSITKKKRERLIPICDPLFAILNEFKKDKGAVFKINTMKMRHIRYALAKASGMKEWKDNALRHSFASYHLALNENAALTSLLIGHKDAATTHRHYARLVRKEDAVKWFN